jgi:hypothetical protein
LNNQKTQRARPKEMFDALKAWLGHCGFEKGSPFQDLGDAMEHHTQADTSSCGLFMLNIIRHELLEEPLMETKDRVAARLELFNSIADAHMEAVCTTLCARTAAAHTRCSSRSEEVPAVERNGEHGSPS